MYHNNRHNYTPLYTIYSLNTSTSKDDYYLIRYTQTSQKYVPAGQLVLISLEGLSHVPHVLVGVICHCHRIYRRF
jgi:hypothetical protein